MTGLSPARVRRANALLDHLVDNGPMSADDLAATLGWPRSAVVGAITDARRHVCPGLGLTIPHPTPEQGWRYMVTDEWEEIEAGSTYAMSHAEARLASVLRDVEIILPKLSPQSRDGRRANFLQKHLSHILATLKEINNG